MTRPILTLLALMALASCGAEGAPVRPPAQPVASAAVGLGAGSVGVTTGGRFSLGLSL